MKKTLTQLIASILLGTAALGADTSTVADKQEFDSEVRTVYTIRPKEHGIAAIALGKETEK